MSAFYFLFIAVILNVAPSFAANPVESITVTLGSKNRVSAVQVSPPTDPQQPTFLFMPGVNRSMNLNDEAIRTLAYLGYGTVSFDFSTQPFSINLLPYDTEPYYATAEDMNLSDFAVETDLIVGLLKQDYNITQVIPVSLSYSGAVSPYLSNYPLIIDTVPMTSWAATNPDLATYRKTLEAGLIFNPIFGPSLIRSAMDTSYRTAWTFMVDTTMIPNGMASEHRTNMIEGYTTMSRIAEDADWQELNMKSQVRRIMMIAANESEELLHHQIETFIKLENAVLVYVEESGHLIPGDQPEAYAKILDLVATQSPLLTQAQVLYVRPGAGEYRPLQGKEAKKFLEALLK